jgi:PDDEXK-like domain of unknown function (DUF3799)
LGGDPVTGYVPGVYDIPEADYFADPALSCSGAKLLLPPSCPALFKYRQDHPEHKDVFDFGSAAHKMVLGAGPELAVLDYENWQTKASKQAREEARDAGATPILAADYAKVKAMAEAIRRHPLASHLINPYRDGKPEQSLFWTDEETGIQRRSRVDWLPERGYGRFVLADYKTCDHADPASIAKAVTNYGYLQQEQWYLDGIRALGLDDNPDFWFVFQEKNAPYLVNVARVKEEDRWIGRARNRDAIEVFRDCTERDVWPGHEGDTEDGITDIELPPWAARNLGVSA